MNNRTLNGLLLALLLIPGSGLSANPGLKEILASPPGRMIDMGTFHMHIHCQGEGSPVVILESGLGGFSLDWYEIQNNLSQSIRVCAYDRAGYGWSEPGPSPRVTDQLVEELEELLIRADIQPPYVLAGHSYGGFNVQYFAKLNPDKVVGMALIEGSHPDQANRIPDIPSHRERSRNSNHITTTFDVSTLKNYPPEIRHRAGMILTSMKSVLTQRREFLYFNQSGVQAGQGGSLPDIPLLVMTRGKRVWPDNPYGDNLERIWMQMQREFLSLTADSWQIIATRSGHLIHLQEPELVIDSIRFLLRKVCQRQQIAANAAASAAFSYCATL
ncbi:MAG: alpha/beta hydrolase [Thiotrichales bacterium]|nr:alpha/beta hydrolase [Thiotrichales bacterium]